MKRNRMELSPIHVDTGNSADRLSRQLLITVTDAMWKRIERAASTLVGERLLPRNTAASRSTVVRQMLGFALASHEQWEGTPDGQKFLEMRKRIVAQERREANRRARAHQREVEAERAAARARLRVLNAA